MIAALLVVTGARVGAPAAFGQRADTLPALKRIAVIQVGLPLLALSLFAIIGVLEMPLALVICLLLAAPSLTGAPNFAIMLGHNPAPGMRMLVLGTALFPLTALPVLTVLDPTGEGPMGSLWLSGQLLLAILASVGLGFGLRAVLPSLGTPRARAALDGCAAILLGVIAVGLMAAVGPLLRDAPATLALWLLAAVAVNFGLLFLTLIVMRKADLRHPIATAIYAGNRNIALFLIVLPDPVSGPLMAFIGCYQIPMYLAPIALARISRQTAS